MTKKHFIQLAKAIDSIQDQATRTMMTHKIGAVCSNINNRFNWQTWEKACNESHSKG